MKQRPLTQFLALSVGLIVLFAIVPVNAASLPRVQPPAQLSYTLDTDGVPMPPPGPPPKPAAMPAVTDGVPMPPPGPPPKP